MNPVPFGALPGFSLAAEIREMAAYYSVAARQVRSGRGGPAVAQARAALFWKLVHHRRMTPAKAAALLKCPRSTVRKGVESHAARIREFLATNLGDQCRASDNDVPGGLAIERSHTHA